MSAPPLPSANQGTQGVSPRPRYRTIPVRARPQPRAAAPSSTAKVWPVTGTGVNGSFTLSWAASPVKAAKAATRTTSRTRSPGSTSASTRRRGRRSALCNADTGGSFAVARDGCSGRPTLRRRAVPPPHPPELAEAPFPAGLVPVAALGRLPLRPHHHVQGAGEDLLVAAGTAVHLGRPVGLHEAQMPAVGDPLQGQRLAPEPPRGLHRRHRPSVRNRRRLVAPMNRFEDAVAREPSTRIKARTRSIRALARWAAASLPPGALVADGVALVLSRLGDGDPDTLAAQVMTETPDRFGRNWESGPAH